MQKITVCISTYTVSVLIKALMFKTPPPDICSLSLVDLVGLAWKHRMKRAKLGSKEAHRLSRGCSRHKYIQTIENKGGLSALWELYFV